jgi:Zinc knuckle
MEVQVEAKEKDNLKRMIQEMINTTIREFQVKHQASAANHANVEGLGGGAMNGSNGAKAVKGDIRFNNMGNNNYMMTPEAVMAIVEAAKVRDLNQLGTMTMLCYNCGQFGHRSDRCRNARNYELVQQTLMAQGQKPCENCGKFGHPAEACWSLPNNAHLCPTYWRGPGQARQGQQTYNSVQGQGQQTYNGTRTRPAD